VIDDPVANAECPVVQVDAAAGVVRDDLQMVADVRPLVDTAMRRRGQTIGVCSHPYDLCTELIAREAGVIVTDLRGGRLDAPLDVFSDVGWIGYANATLRDQIGPLLAEILAKRGLSAA